VAVFGSEQAILILAKKLQNSENRIYWKRIFGKLAFIMMENRFLLLFPHFGPNNVQDSAD